MRSLLVLLSFATASIEMEFPKENDNTFCTLPDGNVGSCVHFLQCANSSDMIKKNKRPNICEFDGIYPIICCQHVNEQRIVENLETQPVGLQFNELCNSTYSKYGTAIPLDYDWRGYNSTASEFPHMAALGYGSDRDIVYNYCAGTLISPKFVLTSAHCLKVGGLGYVKYIRLGDVNPYNDSDISQPQNFKVQRTIKHPLYKLPSEYHDIALIELDRPAVITEYVKPACVRTDDKIYFEWGVAGWGNVEYNGPPSVDLRRIFMPQTRIDECRAYYNTSVEYSRGIVDEWQLCAGGGVAGTCQGDIGGPLQFTNIYRDFIRGQTVIGVTSIGKPCFNPEAPGVYTRVSHYVEWMESIVFAN